MQLQVGYSFLILVPWKPVQTFRAPSSQCISTVCWLGSGAPRLVHPARPITARASTILQRFIWVSTQSGCAGSIILSIGGHMVPSARHENPQTLRYARSV